ncbi:sensor histidine kinase [Pseudokineococcus sp. 1T1Z-3]|uniref:sensor histidine kinase n=1 Tax=Pseudokineococcus sp. 1T1Z-3 TaxID=3132745 RepID=UPI0030B203B9
MTGPGEHQAWARPRPGRPSLLLDVGSGVVAVLVAVLGLGLTRAAFADVPGSGVDGGPPPPLDVLLTVLVALPLCGRRVVPLTGMVVSPAAFITLGVLSPSSAGTFTLNLVLFLVLLSGTAWARDRRRLVAVWVVVLAAMLAWLLAGVLGGVSAGLQGAGAGLLALTALVNVLFFAGAWLGGQALWRAARDRERLRATADQLRAEQGRTARQAVVAERLRIARELHDVVAHHVSSTGVQAAAARRVLERAAPEDAGVGYAAEALRQVERSSRSAVGEMRALLGVLRTPEEDGEGAPEGAGAAPAPPQPGLADLPALVGRARAAGLAVELTVVGSPRELAATTGTTLHRLVQEALANTARHSTSRTARVVVRWPTGDERLPDAPGGASVPGGCSAPVVEVEVTDEGPVRGGTSGTGLGHVGMRERAALVGGAVETGPRPGGGYRVRARYPLAPAVVGT